MYKTWLYLEFKKALRVLPILFIQAMVLILIIGTIAFCTSFVAQQKEEKATIGIVLQEDNALLQMAIDSIQNMESIGSYFVFEQSTLLEGKEQLEKGELMALILLPEGLISSILTGENIPATVYLPSNHGTTVLSKAIEQLLSISVAELQLAQGQIYALHDIKEELQIAGDSSPMELDINLYNMNFLIDRENIFYMPTVSLTGVLSLENQYIAMFFAFYSMLTVLSIYVYMKEQNKIKERLLVLHGISMTKQIIGKAFVIGGIIICNILIMLGLLLLLYPTVFGFMKCSISDFLLWIGLLYIISLSIYSSYCFSTNAKNGMIQYSLIVICLSYFSGIFIPSALLPFGSWVQLLPTTVAKEVWICFFSDKPSTSFLWIRLVAYMVIVTFLYYVAYKKQNRRFEYGETSRSTPFIFNQKTLS